MIFFCVLWTVSEKPHQVQIIHSGRNAYVKEVPVINKHLYEEKSSKSSLQCCSHKPFSLLYLKLAIYKQAIASNK